MQRLTTFFVALTLACTAHAQVEPQAGEWRTWTIASGSVFRLQPPPDPSTSGAELEAIRAAAGNLDSVILAQIRYWDAGSPGYRWMQLTQQLAITEGLPAPMQTRALALVAVAIYDATVAAWDSKYTYMRPHPSEMDPKLTTVIAPTASPSYPSEHAVAAGAASVVLSYLFPDQTQSVTKLAAQAAQSRVAAGVAFPTDAASGMNLGSRVAQQVIAYAKADGSDQVFTGSFVPAPGVWGSANPVTPLAGAWTPWVLTAASQFRPGPPPQFGSNDANAQYALDKNLQRNNTTNHLAWFWQPGFFQPWMQQVETQIFQNHLDANAPRAARVYALETIGQHDATLACWDAKYTYLELRPPQADSTIVPLFGLPQHPGYPSGHACASGAAAAVLSYLFPADAAALNSMGMDAGMSTFDALIHTQQDVNTGFALGQRVGQQVVARAQTDGAN